jgi:glycosyltransferase involved in cell wall biosynthesis
MKVLLINTFDRGGAGSACLRLHHALLKNGIDSTLLTLNKTRQDIKNHLCYEELNISNYRLLSTKLRHNFKKLILSKKLKSINQLKNKASLETDYFSSIQTQYRIEKWSNIESFDVIHLHWVSDFVNWKTFFNSPNIKNIVWTLHDLNPFTGGYHYSNGYQGYIEYDHSPPFLKESIAPNYAYKQLIEKIKILKNKRLIIVPLSNWLMNCSKKSTLFKHYSHYLIPNSVDTDIFKPKNQNQARKILGLPETTKIILFVSDNIKKKRKGFEYLLKALRMMDTKSVTLCCVGNNMESNDNLYSFGHIDDETQMSLIYNAADIFVLPTIEDNLPNVVVESLCCGTPVIGFKIGGMTDMIQSGINGILCDEINSQSLSDNIDFYFKNKSEYNKLEIAQNAHNLYNFNTQANSFTKLYSLISNSKY